MTKTQLMAAFRQAGKPITNYQLTKALKELGLKDITDYSDHKDALFQYFQIPTGIPQENHTQVKSGEDVESSALTVLGGSIAPIEQIHGALDAVAHAHAVGIANRVKSMPSEVLLRAMALIQDDSSGGFDAVGTVLASMAPAKPAGYMKPADQKLLLECL